MSIQSRFTAGFLAALASVTISFSQSARAAEDAPKAPQIYPGALAVRTVTETARGQRITGETHGGNLFTWTETGSDYTPGDLVSIIFDDAGTPDDVTDDVITAARYSGPAAW